MRQELEEQRMRAWFSELRAADRERAIPSFAEVCQGRVLHHGRALAIAAALLVVAGAGTVWLLRDGGNPQAIADWPNIDIVLPEEPPAPPADSPTAPLLTYLEDSSRKQTGDKGLN